MKICQNNFYILKQILFSLLAFSVSPLSVFCSSVIRKVVARLSLSVLLLPLWLGAAMMTSHAQQNAPVNLLMVAPVDINAERSERKEPTDIDQAVDQVMKFDGVNNNFKNELKSNLTVSQINEGKGEVKALDSALLSTTNAAAVNESVSNEALESLPVDGNTAPKSVPLGGGYGSAKIGRRKISDVGLAAIGVGKTANSQLDSLIWRGTSAHDAIFLLEKAAVSGQSQVIKQLAYEVVAQQTVPPRGANDVAAGLVEARLDFLANGGRSSDLAVLVAQLPEAKKWSSWRRWLAEHYLMIRNDSAACSIVERKITQTMELFWHKSNVICQAVQGNLSGARFAADIMVANEINDPIFFSLVDEVLDSKPSGSIDSSNLDTAHIVLMDVANRPIPLEGLSVLPEQMTETVMKLKFLEPDARMVSTFEGLKRGLITHRQAGKLWRNAGLVNDDPKIALARLHGDVAPLTTASTWRALDADKRPGKLALVVEAIKAEIVAGNGAIMLPLYGELVRNALADESVASAMRFDDLNIAPNLAYMLAIGQPNDTETLQAFGGNGNALLVAEFLQGLSDDLVDATVMSALEMWHMLPILEAVGIKSSEVDWLGLVKGDSVSKQTFVNLSPVLLKATTSAAENNRVAETILLSNWLLSDVTLDQTNIADLAIVIRALFLVGQSEVAKGLAHEIVKAHLMQRLAYMVLDGTQS